MIKKFHFTVMNEDGGMVSYPFSLMDSPDHIMRMESFHSAEDETLLEEYMRFEFVKEAKAIVVPVRLALTMLTSSLEALNEPEILIYKGMAYVYNKDDISEMTEFSELLRNGGDNRAWPCKVFSVMKLNIPFA